MLSSNILRRPVYLVIAVVLVLMSALPVFISQKASAYALVTSRSIQMESSADGTTTDGQSVIHKVAFTTATTGNIGSVAVEYCSNNPIIGTACTAPTGLDVNEGSLNFYNQSGITDFTVTPHANTTTNRVVLTRTAASVTAATAVSFDMGNGTNGIDNPDGVNGTFYARIYTYVATNGTGTEVDAGGVALSTAAQIVITAKVQERLVFCVYTTGAGNNCTTKSGTAVTLGDTNGILDPAGPYVDKNAKFSITTNANSSAIVRLKGQTLYRNADTTCASAANCITATSSTPVVSALGTEQFGLCLYESAGSGLTRDTVYDGGAGAECAGTTQTAGTGSTGGAGTAEFGLDTTGAGTTSTYGDTLATKPAGDYSTAIMAFIGNVANSTEAGIYVTTLTFIATGTY